MTGLWDTYHSRKRFYQNFQPNGSQLSFLICETNNSISSEEKSMVSKVEEKKLSEENRQGLTYIKRKSDYVTSAQEAGIDLAMTTAYTWNKNIHDFTNVVKRLVGTNLG